MKKFTDYLSEEQGRYYHLSPIPVDVVERSLTEIEEFINECRAKKVAGGLIGKALGIAYELKNILVTGKVKNTL